MVIDNRRVDDYDFGEVGGGDQLERREIPQSSLCLPLGSFWETFEGRRRKRKS
jgi:hypothetical protein